MEPARTISLRGTQGRNTKVALIPALKGGVCERRSINAEAYYTYLIISCKAKKGVPAFRNWLTFKLILLMMGEG